MSKKKILLCIMLCILAVFTNIFLIFEADLESFIHKNVDFVCDIKGNARAELQLYYAVNGEFTEGESQIKSYDSIGESQTVIYSIDAFTNTLRLDFPDGENGFVISELSYFYNGEEYGLDLEKVVNENWINSITNIELKEDKIYLETSGQDAYLGINMNEQEIYPNMISDVEKSENIIRYILCIVIDILVGVILVNIKKVIEIPQEIFEQRKLIISLSKNDLKTRFSGSYLGVFWAFVQPVVTVLVYWFVFQVGLKNGNVQGYPYVLWLVAGLVPWFFFSEAWGLGTNALIEYSYLVKKVVFKIDILPVVKIVSSIYVHLFFVCFVIILCWCYGYWPDLYLLQIIYYIVCNIMFTMGLAYITASLAGFVKDLIQIINIILQIGVWLTPIMWNAEQTLGPKLALLMKLNPMYYIVDGFRDALLYENYFWDKPIWTVYFWMVTILIFMLGVHLFKRLKVHFADVL